MARINYPDITLLWIKLFKVVKPKVIALPVPNTISIYMTENNVVLADDEADVLAAEAAQDVADEKDRAGEKHTEQGDKLVKKCKADHRACCQNLKTVYRSAPHKLGDWGITVNGREIVYKTNIDEHAVEMQALITKHNTYAAGTSPLQPLLDDVDNDIDLAQNALDIATALTEYAAAKADHDASETKNAEVRLKLNPVIEHVRGIGQAAVKMYAANPHKAGDLGFTIDESAKPAVLRTFELATNEEIDLSKLDVGSFVTVVGEGEVTIFPKGEQAIAKGNRGVANGQQKFLLSRGFGSSMIKNTGSTAKVKFTAFFNH